MDSSMLFQGQNFISTNTQFTMPTGGYKPEPTEPFMYPEQMIRTQKSPSDYSENQGGQMSMPMYMNDPSQVQFLSFQEAKVLIEKRINEFLQNKNERQVPIPKGNSAYSKAKRAEYIERNLDKAVKFYKISIKNNERVDSAIKDLATVLHQQGKTGEACKFLETHRPLYKGDLNKYDNLWNNLKKQIIPSGNCLNRTFILPNVNSMVNESDIRGLFGNDSRIVDVSFCHTWKEDEVAALPPLQPGTKLGFVSFVSYSAARKTFETVKDTNQDFYWMNVRGEILSRVANDSLNTSRDSEDFHSPKLPFNKGNGQPIRRSSFFAEHSARMNNKMQSPGSHNEISSQYPGFYPQNFPLNFPTQNHHQAWNNPGIYGQPPFQTGAKNVVKRLSFSTVPVSNPLANIAAKKRWSTYDIPVYTMPEKTWNCAVFVDMEDSEKSSSSSGTTSSCSSDDEYDEEEMKELELKKKNKERAKSLREAVCQEFSDPRFPVSQGSQDTLSTLDSRSDRGYIPSPNMKYNVLSEIKKKEELLQKEKDSDRSGFLKNLILKRNDVLTDELQLAKDPRKAGDRRTSWDPNLIKKNYPWIENNTDSGKNDRNI